MRDDYPREKTSVLTWLICAIGAGYVVQLIFSFLVTGPQASKLDELMLTVGGIKAGHVWILVTHSFLHSLHPFHVLANVVLLYFLGRELLPILGARRFLGLYAGATLLGALSWTLVHWRTGNGELYGATAGVDALLIVFACFYPYQRLDFLFLFVFPISLKPKHLAFGLAVFDLVGLVFEIRGLPLPWDIAITHSAHIGGMLAGWIYFRYVHDVRWQLPTPPADVELPRWVKREAKIPTPEPASQVNIANRADLRAELDRILDKINSHGLGALTVEEKRLLDEAKDLLSRR